MTFELGKYRAAVFDLDGTVWLSDVPIPGAVEFVDRCRDAGLTITFATNATAVSVAALTDALLACGLGRPGDGVVTGGSVVAATLGRLGVTEVITEVSPAMASGIVAAGVTVIPASGVGIPDGWAQISQHKALVMSAYREATFGSVELIGRLANLGHPLYVTSLDPSFPAHERLEPGGGMLTTALQAIYPDVEPIPLGKPSQAYADVVRELVRTDDPVVVFGDSQRADMGIADLLGADGVLISANLRVSPELVQPRYVTTTLEAEPIVHEVAVEVWP